MTGWSRQEASGRQKVLRLIDTDTCEPAMNPRSLGFCTTRSVGLSAKVF
jgi:hypothetical protein